MQAENNLEFDRLYVNSKKVSDDNVRVKDLKPNDKVTVEVKVSSSGSSRIVNLLKDGKPVKIKYEPVNLTS